LPTHSQREAAGEPVSPINTTEQGEQEQESTTAGGQAEPDPEVVEANKLV